ncbi:MAG: tRNA (adenosine(37)-N6)-threonylcarbamoyltransferase complex transferase subunit TsaD [Verrucomicrobiota bacterium]
MKPVLGIESSCDETSVAVLEIDNGKPQLLAHQIASQLEYHMPFGGVVPEVATRQHMRHLDPMVASVLGQAGVELNDLGLIAATRGPGLASSLMIGYTYALGLGAGSGVPVTGINHIEGHLFSPFLSAERHPVYPHLALIVSGGHTMLVHVKAPWSYEIIGKTRDDAAGEAFDKVAKLLGMEYPGGPEVEKRATAGKAERFNFPRSMLHSGDYAFSFSGLKTAVRYTLEKLPGRLTEHDRADVCAGFQQAVIDVLCGKSQKALEEFDLKLLTVSGGVSCNQTLVAALQKMCEEVGVEFLPSNPKFSTDNAAMITYAAALRQQDGVLISEQEDIDPNLSL